MAEDLSQFRASRAYIAILSQFRASRAFIAMLRAEGVRTYDGPLPDFTDHRVHLELGTPLPAAPPVGAVPIEVQVVDAGGGLMVDKDLLAHEG